MVSTKMGFCPSVNRSNGSTACVEEAAALMVLAQESESTCALREPLEARTGGWRAKGHNDFQ